MADQLDESQGELEHELLGEAWAPSQCPVVGIGASAGGIEACSELLRNLSPPPGMAIILVQHLDPHHESMLSKILARETALPVTQAKHDEPALPNHVYVIPPNSAITIEQGRLKLGRRLSPDGAFMPIDLFFRSLARDCGRMAVGVVLSGGGTDGALGLEEIKAADGVTFVQEESTARQVAMPRSAISMGCVDFVLPPGEIARQLTRLGSQYFSPGGLHGGKLTGMVDGLPKIFALVHNATGIDFSEYKRTTIKRRIARRMGVSGLSRLHDYIALLQEQPTEIRALYEDFLIRVTSFFRDPHTFETLQKVVFPQIISNRPAGAPIRVWVSGCSTGEEVYSIAIALIEVLGDMASNTPLKFLATDISESALERARVGRYIDNIAMDVSPERLRRFFSKVDGSYQISQSIRDLCVFSRHNVARDTPFANVDLISCRNLLIYLNLQLQKRVLSYFHYALKPHGYLMLGTSETIGAHADLYEIVDNDSRIYVKKPHGARPAIDFSAFDVGMSPSLAKRSAEPATSSDSTSVQGEVDRLLLTRYGPPAVVINEQLEILHFQGKAARYLNPARGVPSLALLKPLRAGIMDELRQAVEQAKLINRSVRLEDLQLREDDQLRRISVDVMPLPPHRNESRVFLVVFEEHPPLPPGAEIGAATAEAADLPAQTTHLRMLQLECQLSASREYLQSVVEENETGSEELKAANEEILSSNEELQSTNEELQTAKEEMQSTNEELATVNDELRNRNKELGHLYDDLLNLLAGLDIPIILVSRQLRIRRFTQSAAALFNLIPTDLGRPISDLRPNVDLPDLPKQLNAVIESLESLELEVRTHADRWYSLRIRPYITSDNRIDGAALVLIDIDVLKRATDQLKASRNNAEAIVETVWEPLLVLDEDLRIQRANSAFYRLFELEPGKVDGMRLPEVDGSPWDQPELLAQLQAIIPENRRLRDLEVEAEFPGLGRRTVLLNGHRIFWEGSGTQMVLLAIEDVTNRKREMEQARLLAREQAARAEAESQNRMKDEFLAMLAHELRNPLAPIRNSFGILEQRFADDELVHHILEISDRQISHMSRLLDDLLDVSRITQGKIQLRLEVVHFQKVIEDAIEGCRPHVDSRGHRLEVSMPPQPLYLKADSARLQQILCNLLNNAAKYTDPGGTISIDIKQHGDWIMVQVKDTGVGIAKSLLPRVFDLFTQSDRSLDRSQGGLGIGLTLVKNLVGLHGGTVVAFSEGEGRGSTFTVRLPALQIAAAIPARSAAPPSLDSQPRRILVVDDNVDSALTLAILLRNDGHQVTTAHSGRDALALAAHEQPEVVLLDIGLPEMNGFEVAAKFRADPKLRNMLIIAVTGYGREDDFRRGQAAGIDFHLIKPLDHHELARILATGQKNGKPGPAKT